MQRADQLRRAVGSRFNVSPFLSGSMATGLNLPGKFDYDYGIRVNSREKFDKLVGRLNRATDVQASPYNTPGTDYHVFTGKIQGEDVDLALMFGDKGKQVRDGLNAALRKVEQMPPEERDAILRRKGQLKALQNMPIIGGIKWKGEPAVKRWLERPWKRKLDQSLGMARIQKDLLPPLQKEGRALSDAEMKRLSRADVFGHRTGDLTPLISSGEILSAATAAKRGLLKTVETANPFSRARGVVQGPTSLRSEVFITKGLLPPSSTYGQYGVLFEKRKKEKSRYLNLIPEEHTTEGVKGRSMTFVVPDNELGKWEQRFPDRRIIGESQVPSTKHLPAKSLGVLAQRIIGVPLLFQKTEVVG